MCRSDQLRLTIGVMARNKRANFITEGFPSNCRNNDVAGDVAIADFTHEYLA